MLSADNVRKDVKFVCHCCACCCNVLSAINKYGYPNALVTSSYLAAIEEESCLGCGKCARACPIEAIAMVPDAQALRKIKLPPASTPPPASAAAFAPSSARPGRVAW